MTAMASPSLASPADLDPGLLMRMYESMQVIRLTEERLAELLEAGEVNCPTHLYTGQEAIAVGVSAALETRDYSWGGHRSHGHYLAKGAPLDAMIAEIFGRVTGCARGRGGSMHLIAPEVGFPGTVPIVGATIPIAVGAGLASKLRGDGGVSVAFFGDGAVEEGVFHESMNLAAVYRAPVLFVCENNFFSSHMHLTERRALDNIVDSGGAHGMPAEALDGNDVVAVYQAAKTAVARARAGDGPSFLECRTYRWRGHVGPSLDMDVGVKRKDELGEWRERDPIRRLYDQLVSMGVGRERLDEVTTEVNARLERAIEAARTAELPDPESLGMYLFADGDAR